MFPIKTVVKTKPISIWSSKVVFALIALNCFVFWQEIKSGVEYGDQLIRAFGLVPVRDFSSADDLLGQRWLQFFSSMYLHGGFLHLIANLWTLWIFGGSVESALGSIRFLVFYTLCGLVAAVAHVFLNPMSDIPMVGASGAISGVMGAFVFLYPRSRIKMLTLLIFYPVFFEIPAVIFLLIWFLGQLMAAAAQGSSMESGGIAFAAHIGGFIAGVVLHSVFKKN